MKQRILTPEIIDLGKNYYNIQEYNKCLYQLGRINKYLGCNGKLIKIIKNAAGVESILDVGCGGGQIAWQLAKSFPKAKVVGIDINPDAINFANSFNEKLSNLKYELKNIPELTEKEKSYDIVTSTLVCHHLTDDQIVDFLKRAQKVAKKKIVLNDLQRSWVSYLASKIIMPIFFPNRLVRNDSALSIKKSFRRRDWVIFLKQAKINEQDYKIVWCWPFRWIIEIDIK